MRTLRTFLSLSIATAVTTLFFPLIASASVYGGGGLIWGASVASVIVGVLPLRIRILYIISAVLSYMALIAVVVIAIAGIILVVGGGEDTAKDRTKKMIIYTIVGLAIIAATKAIVIFLVVVLS